jgi:hypothetical protein
LVLTSLSPLFSAVLPVKQVRKMRFGSHEKSLREPRTSHGLFPPPRQGDFYLFTPPFRRRANSDSFDRNFLSSSPMNDWPFIRSTRESLPGNARDQPSGSFGPAPAEEVSENLVPPIKAGGVGARQHFIPATNLARGVSSTK